MPGLEKWGASESTQPVAVRCSEHAEAHLKSCRDEQGCPGVIGVKRKTMVNYPKGIKGCSSKKVTKPS